jgi:phage shock protein C
MSTDRTNPTNEPAPASGPPPAEVAPTSRQLRRRVDSRIIAGVCGGLADYFGIDPVLVRVAFVVITFAGGAGLLAYIILWIVMPPAAAGTLMQPVNTGVANHGSFWLGGFLVMLGVLFLLGNTGWFWWWNWSIFWPVVLVALGVLILSRQMRGR